MDDIIFCKDKVKRGFETNIWGQLGFVPISWLKKAEICHRTRIKRI